MAPKTGYNPLRIRKHRKSTEKKERILTATIHAFLTTESTPVHFRIGCFGRKITNSLASFISKHSLLFSLERFFLIMVLLKIGPSREKGKLQLIFSRGYIYRKFQIEYHKIYAKSDGDIFLNPPGDR